MVIPDDHCKKWFEVMGELRTKVEKVKGCYDVSKWIRQLYHVKPELRHLFDKEWVRVDPMRYEQYENELLSSEEIEEIEEIEETSRIKTDECVDEKQISLEDKVKRLEEENKNLWKMIDDLYNRVDMVMQIARESRY